jgi:hypothetical protein
MRVLFRGRWLRGHRLLAAALLILTFRTAGADEKLAGIACRSVHLSYPAADALIFTNEVTVEKSAPGTYFEVCGWSRGYFGMQELADGHKLLLFSVWDSASNDTQSVPDAERVQAIDPAEGVRVKRFGNEGSGGQSFFDYDWKVGETYRFAVSVRDADERTQYSGWFFHPEKKEWVRLNTFRMPTKTEPLRGLYSFIEDFRRNTESAGQARIARFGHGWVLDEQKEWKPLRVARFTGDSNPATNIDAGVRDGRYFLATGGDVENQTTKLNGQIPQPAAATEPAADLSAIVQQVEAPAETK